MENFNIETVKINGEDFTVEKESSTDPCLGCHFMFTCRESSIPKEYTYKCATENIIYTKRKPKTLEEQIKDTELEIFVIEQEICLAKRNLEATREKLKRLQNERNKRS